MGRTTIRRFSVLKILWIYGCRQLAPRPAYQTNWFWSLAINGSSFKPWNGHYEGEDTKRKFDFGKIYLKET